MRPGEGAGQVDDEDAVQWSAHAGMIAVGAAHAATPGLIRPRAAACQPPDGRDDGGDPPVVRLGGQLVDELVVEDEGHQDGVGPNVQQRAVVVAAAPAQADAARGHAQRRHHDDVRRPDAVGAQPRAHRLQQPVPAGGQPAGVDAHASSLPVRGTTGSSTRAPSCVNAAGIRPCPGSSSSGRRRRAPDAGQPAEQRRSPRRPPRPAPLDRRRAPGQEPLAQRGLGGTGIGPRVTAGG